MDYDGNDFQGHNLQLAAEGGSKLSPVLRPYALPKFDFEEGLHGHLRFDSLVENEVFLGIPSEEDNQWIEDFSRGASGIEFNTSAAQSCPILRHNNVWSEATSSESVEMLLKSVGQEDFVPGKTIVEKSDACHELGRVTVQMDPHMKQEDKVKDVMVLDPVLPSGEFLEHFSRLKDVESSSQAQEPEISVHGSSCAVEPNASTEMCGAYVTQNSPGVSRKCNDENQIEIVGLVNESLNNIIQKDSSNLGMQIDDIESSLHTSRLKDIQSSSQKQQPEIFIHGSSRVLDNLDPNASSQTLVTENNPGVARKCDSENQIESNTSVNKSLDSRVEKDPSGLKMQIVDVDSSLQDIAESVEVFNKQDSGNQASDSCFVTANLLSTDTVKAAGNYHFLSKEVHMDDQNLKLTAFETGTHKSEKLSRGYLNVEPTVKVETGMQNFEEPSNSAMKSSDFQIAENCTEHRYSNDPAQSSELESMDMSNRKEILQQCRQHVREDSFVGLQGDSIYGHEVSCMTAGRPEISSGKGLKSGQITDGENSSFVGKGPSQLNDNHLDNNASVSNTEAPLLSGIYSNVFDRQGDRSSCNNAGHMSSLAAVCSSTDLYGKTNPIENPKIVDDASGFHQEVLETEKHVGSSLVVGSVQTQNRNSVPNPNDKQPDHDVYVSEKEEAKLPNDSSNMESGGIIQSCNSDKLVDASSNGEVTRGDKLNLGSECDTTLRNKSDLNVDLENTNLASHGILDDAPLLSGRGVTENQLTDHLDKNKKSEDEVLTEENLLSSKESLERERPCLLVELERGASHVSAQELSHEAVDKSLPAADIYNSGSRTGQAGQLQDKSGCQTSLMTETCTVASQSNCAAKTDDIMENSSNKLDVCPTLGDSTVKQDGGAEGLVVHGNHDDEAAVGKDHENASSTVADSDEPKCGNLTVTSCSMLSQSEKDNKVAVNELLGSDIPVSEVSVHSMPQNVSANDATKDKSTFTIEVHPSACLSERETSKDAQSVSATQACKASAILEGSLSSLHVMDAKAVSVPSERISPAADGKVARGAAKGSIERKSRRASAKTTRKENGKRVNNVNEASPSRKSERGVKTCSESISLLGTGQFVQFEGLKPCGNVGYSGTVPCSIVSTSMANVLDLNNSALPSALFKQHFTDLQQAQLRAQIFVYGSLIQGTAPDEAFMVSAFGSSEGERNAWEPVWRACVQRLRSQKSIPTKSDNSVHPHSGAKTPDPSMKQGALQSNVLPLPVARASSKADPSPVANSFIPLSSPLWNASTPVCDGLSSGKPRSSLLDYHQTVSPLHPFQSPPTQSFVGRNSSWFSQAPFPGPWVASPQTPAIDSSAYFSAIPLTETVNPNKESALVSSGTKHASHFSVVHSACPSALTGTTSLPDMEKVALSSGLNSIDPKTRKRKKVTLSENIPQVSLRVHPRIEPFSAPVVTNHLSTSVVVPTTPCFTSKSNACKIVTDVSPTSLTDNRKRGEQNAEQKATLSENTLGEVEESKRQPGDEAAFVAGTVSHSQSMCIQLDELKSSGLTPDVEAKLASAAVAVAAAASVAKAAAAAARIASNAALQAKLMADEVMVSSGASDLSQSSANSLSNVVNKFSQATPMSILKAGDGNNSSSSIIIAAREAARRRVEAASAASKHAENLDAIVKAAELAAEAVSQAGKIVAMDDSFPLNELVEAGLEGFCRVVQVPPKQVVISNNGSREQSKVDSIEGGVNVSDKCAQEISLEEARDNGRGLSPLPREASRELLEDHTRAVDGASGSFASTGKDSREQRKRRASDLAKTIGVVPESEIGLRSPSTAQNEHRKAEGSLLENQIKEGSLVEVLKDSEKFKAAWFSANVLSLKDGKAFVCYTELQSDDGPGKLKEWVRLEGTDNGAPGVRMAPPTTATGLEGTRKRRRAAMGDYAWSEGDRVDAWTQGCWREGVITERNKKDDTSVTVHFPACGETSAVRVWHLRPTLIWKDGEWTEWSSSREKEPSSQGDTPQEKRLKFGSSSLDGSNDDNISNIVELVDSAKLDESQLLPLSAKEKVFNVGKNTRGESKHVAHRIARSGLQKEGSRVIFGVPKPGKKRKYMDMSKHYVAERSSKTNESNDSVKFAKYLVPQGSGIRGWKNTKVDVKEKQPAESKNKVLKSGKARSVSGRAILRKDKFSSSELSAHIEGIATVQVIKDSVNAEDNESEQQNLMEFGSVSNTEGPAEGPVLFSSLAVRSDPPSKKKSTSNSKSERVNRGKLAISTGMDKHDSGNPGKLISEVAEPRRSNRRIQPTSRLLEGLQSSLIISKIHAASHEKSNRSLNGGTPKAGGNHG